MTVTTLNPSNNPTTAMPQDELGWLSGAIAVEMMISGPDASRRSAIGSNLMRRARASVLAHRSFVTLRRESRVYVEVSPGVRSSTLREAHGVRVDLVRLEAGAALSWPSDVVAQEILVMTGTLQGPASESLAQHELVLRRRHDEIEVKQRWFAGVLGAHLYVRQLVAVDRMPALERTWWESDDATQATEWEPLSEGVEIKGLRCVGDVVSTLARIAPGAVVLDHGHRLDEDCMMLSGDVFLGDILLRELDYQVAPAGCNHVNSMSDTGAVFYFHGCMPTAL